MTQEATSAPDSGQLPSEITEAIMAYGRAEYSASTYGTAYSVLAARAELTAKIAKYGNDNWLLGYDNRRDAELEQANDDR